MSFRRAVLPLVVLAAAAACSDEVPTTPDGGSASSSGGSSSSSGGSSSSSGGSSSSSSSGGSSGSSGGDGGIDFAEVTSFGANPGGLKMFLHAPPRAAAGAGVVVVLHGCTQTAADVRAIGWEALADARGFYVVYAEQTVGNNVSRCFRWWEPAQTQRGGEAASIAGMAAHVATAYGTTRAFVTGLSSGGAMAVALLANYADRFSAGSAFAGIPYGCATSLFDSIGCTSGVSKSADTWGTLVRDALAANPAPRIQLWQGSSDFTVRPANLPELVKQWTNVHGLTTTATATDAVGTAIRKRYGATTAVEAFDVQGMDHGVPVDPKGGCGKAGPYALDVGICGAGAAADFFKL